MDWFNSEPVKIFRTKMFQDQLPSECQRCLAEEQNGGISRRIRSNQKSVIFTRVAFIESFKQSPGYQHFEYSRQTQGQTQTYPIDLHIDLGNFCNLACKMCNAQASSTIASQHVQWGIQQDRKYLGTDWTRDTETWNNFKKQLLEIPGLNNIHFMGGETLLTPRFENLVDCLIENRRFDLSLSFVTNGTVFKPALIEKLKRFRRVGLEISIETVTQHNNYVRQGTDTDLVLSNIKKYMSHGNDNSVTVTLRPAPSLLTVGYYTDLLQFALDNKLIVKSNLCFEPEFLKIENLPTDVKTLYIKKFKKFLLQFDRTTKKDFNTSDPSQYENVIQEQAEMFLSLLSQPAPTDNEQQMKNLVEHCQRWDRIYNLDAKKLYPELDQVWKLYGY
jgi:sulfatase maturation enzyme AslB (radical SAM superfamily)